MKPKGIRKAGIIHARDKAYSGIAVDILSSITIERTQISATVEVNNPTANPTNTISETVLVTVT